MGNHKNLRHGGFVFCSLAILVGCHSTTSVTVGKFQIDKLREENGPGVKAPGQRFGILSETGYSDKYRQLFYQDVYLNELPPGAVEYDAHQLQLGHVGDGVAFPDMPAETFYAEGYDSRGTIYGLIWVKVEAEAPETGYQYRLFTEILLTPGGGVQPSWAPSLPPTSVPSPSPSSGLRERIRGFLENDLKPVTSQLDHQSAQEMFESAIFLEMAKIYQDGYGSQDILGEFEYVLRISPPVMGNGSQGYAKKKSESAGKRFIQWAEFSFGPIPRSAIPTPLPYEFIKSNEKNTRYKRVIPIFYQLIEKAEEGVAYVGIGEPSLRNQPFNYGNDDKKDPIVIPVEPGKPRDAITVEEANILAEWWVGVSDVPLGREQWFSLDGWKRYRVPSWKSSRNEWQANYEIARTPYNFELAATNGHLSVKDPSLARPRN